MKLRFENAATLEAGIALLADELGITVVNEGADVTVSVRAVAENVLCVTWNAPCAEIVYGGVPN